MNRDGSWWICSFQKIWESNYRTTSQLAELRAVTADAQGGTKARRQQWQHHHSHQPWRKQLRTTNSSQFRRASWGLRPVYHSMSVRYAKTGLYRLHKPWLFSSGRARFSSKKYRNSFGKSPPPFHMQVAIQSNHLHLIIQSNHVRLMCWRCLRPNRSIGYLISPVSSSSRHRLRQSWLMFAVPHSSDQNSWFEHGKDIRSEVPAIEVSVPYLLPLNLRETSRAPIYIWQKQATHHSSETCLCILDLPIVDLTVPVQYRCINLSEITSGHPLAIWDVIGKPHVYLWIHVSMLLPFDKQMEFPSQPCWMITNSCSYMHRAKQRPPVTSGWAVAKAVLWRTSYDIFQNPQTKMTGDCDMSTASSKKKKNIMRVANAKKMCQDLWL